MSEKEKSESKIELYRILRIKVEEKGQKSYFMRYEKYYNVQMITSVSLARINCYNILQIREFYLKKLLKHSFI